MLQGLRRLKSATEVLLDCIDNLYDLGVILIPHFHTLLIMYRVKEIEFHKYLESLCPKVFRKI
jgi:hypothetical protein